MQSQKRIADLTINEFTDLLREIIHEAQAKPPVQPLYPLPLQGLLDLEPIDLGSLNPPDAFIRREDFYDDEC